MSAQDSVRFDVAGTTQRTTTARALLRNFLGHSPIWYKVGVIAALILNPLLLLAVGPTITGWLIVAEFIATLAMALKCYPLQPGGLIAIEAVLLGLTTPQSVYGEVVNAYPVILLLIFMVAGIHFLKDLLIYAFTKLLLSVRAPGLLAVVFCFSSAVLSAFLDALTVLAVVITIGNAFYEIYHKVACGKPHHLGDHDVSTDVHVKELNRTDLENFRSFLRGLVMHAAVGTAIGGVTTQVGEPQNLLIAKQADWDFLQFFVHVAPVSLPVLAVGVLTCLIIEQLKLFGYGTPLPASVRAVIEDYAKEQSAHRTPREVAVLIVQAAATVVLVVALALHLAEVGLIGLLVIVLATSFAGVTEERRIGKAFEEALPFTALLVVFLVVVAAIHDQHLFEPVIDWVLTKSGKEQAALFYVANGVLSAISDNVFVATIYITEVKAALLEGVIDQTQFHHLAVAINGGTNIPSIATPNGQAAFLFLLTSAFAPLVRLSYGRMIWMALPYTITLSITGLLAIIHWL